MSKTKILVTGGAGYIGSHTVVSLQSQGYEPIILDNFYNSEAKVLDGIEAISGSRPTFFEGDCNDKSVLQKILEEYPDINGVIHFAAYKAVGESVQEPLKYYYNNLNSLISLLEMMSEYQVPNLVFSSSCTVYGQPDKLPVTENTPTQQAESPYGNTKQISEEIISDTVKSEAGIKAIALRYFNPIGAHPSGLIGELPVGLPNNLVPFVTQTAAGEREQLTVFGDDYDTSDGSCIRDYIHVMDLAEAHIAAFKYLDKQSSSNHYEVFNVGNGAGDTVLEVIETFEKATGVKVNYKIGPRRPGDVEKIYANVDKARTELGWSHQYSLADALSHAWQWQKKVSRLA